MLRSILLLLLLALTIPTSARFFAMDTGLSGPPEEVTAILSELGFDGYGAGSSDLEAIAGALEKRGLRLENAYHTVTFEPGTETVTPELRRCLEQLGRHRATLWLAVRKAGGDDPLAITTDAVREIGKVAGEHGAKVSIYPHAGFQVERFETAVELAAAVGLGNVGVTFNLCHWLKVEGEADPIPAIAKAAAKLQFVTVNGADAGDTRTMGWDRLIQPLGRGSYDVGKFVRRLKHEVRWQGPVGLQLYGVKGDRRDNLDASISAWREMSGSLAGKVFCGYQGWFRAAGDDSGLGWRHYEFKGDFRPGKVGIEMWPDVSELTPEERFATPFQHADGTVAEVFSSVTAPTVVRHFQWMKDHGIDGVFLQRFATETRDEKTRASLARVLENCRQGARVHDRRWAMMYDLSGLATGGLDAVKNDWLRLIERGQVDLLDHAYLWHQGRPLVSLWGFGFNDRRTDVREWTELVRFFHDQGCAVMLGVPYYWRTLDRDATGDPAIHELMASVEVLSPWAVGRLATPQDAAARVRQVLKPDMAWCAERGIFYLPVIFPGFSWHNLEQARGREADFDSIPRRGGKFFWSQAVAANEAGAEAIYVAMFDEMDEGTAIFKTTSDPPIGPSPFLKEPGIPSDHYLWLTGQIGEMLRGETGRDFPARPR